MNKKLLGADVKMMRDKLFGLRSHSKLSSTEQQINPYLNMKLAEGSSKEHEISSADRVHTPIPKFESETPKGMIEPVSSYPIKNDDLPENSRRKQNKMLKKQNVKIEIEETKGSKVLKDNDNKNYDIGINKLNEERKVYKNKAKDSQEKKILRQQRIKRNKRVQKNQGVQIKRIQV